MLVALSDEKMDRLARRVALLKVERKFPAIGYMELFLTEDCNLRCDYCFVKGKNPTSMSQDTAFAAVDLLIRASRGRKDIGILFFGGEPLLRYDLIQSIVPYAKERAAERGQNIWFDMTTNGTLLNREMLWFFKDHGVKFLLSIDGDREDHDSHRRTADGRGSFDLVMRNLPLAKAYQPWQGSRYTVYPDGVRNLARNVESLFSRGINQFIIGPAFGVPWRANDVGALEDELRKVCDLAARLKAERQPFRMTLFERGAPAQIANRFRGQWGCGAGRGRICVSARGEIYGCSKLASVAGLDSGILCLGTVGEGFTDPSARAMLNDSSTRNRHKCRHCEYADFCSGNCPAHNFAGTGSIFEPNEMQCAFMPVYVRLAAYAQNAFRDEQISSCHDAPQLGPVQDEPSTRRAGGVRVPRGEDAAEET